MGQETCHYTCIFRRVIATEGTYFVNDTGSVTQFINQKYRWDLSFMITIKVKCLIL